MPTKKIIKNRLYYIDGEGKKMFRCTEAYRLDGRFENYGLEGNCKVTEVTKREIEQKIAKLKHETAELEHILFFYD